MDKFTTAYIEAALWSSTDESTPQGGYPLDKNYSVDDIAPECLAQMEADCKDFQQSFGDVILLGADGPDYTSFERAGHDFWLTRNRHGAGFWDGDWGQSFPNGGAGEQYETLGDYLTAMSRPYGEVNLYVGYDGKIYC